MSERDDPSPPDEGSLLRRFERSVRDRGKDPLAALADLFAGSLEPGPEVLQLQGEVLLGYRLIEIVGVGGMGATYRAVDAQGRVAAVKVVGGLSPDRRERFEAECSFLQALDHPYIVRYRGHGFLGGARGFIVMDFVEGLSLEALLCEIEAGAATHSLSVELRDGDPRLGDADASRAAFHRRIVRMIAKVVAALAHAHGSGIVHRDLKPANVLIKSGLDPVLIDFGLSRDLFRNVSLTRSRALVGTIAYMAPEQLDGADGAGPPADIFSVGLVLYRALTGVPLRQSIEEVVAFGHPGVVLERPEALELPPPLLGILYRCLDSRPAKRYPSMRELKADLDAFASGAEVSARTPGWLRRRWRTVRGRFGVSGVGLLVAIALAVTIFVLSKGHYLSIDALGDACDLVLDGKPMGRSGPFTGVPVEPGHHIITLGHADSAVWPLRHEFDVSDYRTRVVLLNVHEDPKTGPLISKRVYEGADRCLLHVTCWVPGVVVTVDGVPSSTSERWIQIAKGPHRITATAPSGEREVQEVDLRPGELNEVHLLWRHTQIVPGRFRRTVGNVLSPLPKDVRFDLGSGASRFLNGFSDRDKSGPGYLAWRASITAEEADRLVEASVTVTFPEPMHSVVLAFNATTLDLTATLEIAYLVDDGVWHEIPGKNSNWSVNGGLDVDIPPDGAHSLTLRGLMRVKNAPIISATALEFLYGAGDVVPTSQEGACFAVVADPKPGVARAER